VATQPDSLVAISSQWRRITLNDQSFILDCGGRPLDLSRPCVMGVLNVTPDSFSDGGQFEDLNTAIHQALRMQAEGADIIDVGGESTRPGARRVSQDEELHRVIPVIEALSGQLSIPISIDTSKAGVMQAAAQAGAGMINDINGLRGQASLAAATATGLPVCIMHMQGKPDTMQDKPEYDDVVQEVLVFFRQRLKACAEAGIDPQKIIIDPGFGFGKTLDQNLELLSRLDEFRQLGRPLMAGLSRKSMLGKICGTALEDRLHASLAAATIACQNGADILRVHDVAPTIQALALCGALQKKKAELTDDR